MSNPWNIKKEDFPNNGSLVDKIKFVLGYAVLAPSTHNSQPWLFKIGSDLVKIYYNPRLRLPEADPKGRDLYISMGCMVENLLIAANMFGIYKDMRVVLADNFVAEVFFQNNGEKNRDLEYLVNAMSERVNARGVFDSNKLPDDLEMELFALNKSQRLKLGFIKKQEQMKELASLTAEGIGVAYKKKSFRKEMYKWIRNDLTSKKNGMPGYSLRMPFILSFIIPTLVRFFDISPLLGRLNYKSISSASMACVIGSERSGDDISFEVGRLAQRLMLHLNANGVRTSIFVASIEMGDLYKKVQKILGNDLIPQFLFCIGYMKSVQPHSPRQSVEEKLI